MIKSLDFCAKVRYKQESSYQQVKGSSSLDDIYNEIDNFRDLIDSNNLLNDETLLCECLCVSAGDLRQNFTPNTFILETLNSWQGMGTGCGQCLKNFENWKNKIF